MLKRQNDIKRTLLLTIVLFLLVILNVLSKNDRISDIYIILASIPFYFLIFNDWHDYKENIRRDENLKYWYLFVIIVFISELQNGFIRDSILLFIFPYIFIKFKITLDEFLAANILSIFPIMIVTLVFGGNKFSGNRIGLYVAFLIISIILYFINLKEKKKWIFAYLLVLFVATHTLIVNNSRTSLLVVVLTVGFIITIEIFRNRQRIKVLSEKRKIYKTLIVVSILIAIVMFIIVFKNYIFINKWDNGGDVSSGRFDIWFTTIKHSNLFGHGYNWYNSLYKYNSGPHNGIIGILAFSGIVGVIFFLTFLIKHFWNLIKNFMKSESTDIVIILSLLFSSIVKSLTESLILTTSSEVYSLTFYFSVAYLGYIKNETNEQHQVNMNLNKKQFGILYMWVIIALLGGVYGSVFEYNMVETLIRFFEWFH